jgi:hypothetical protein
LSKIVPYPAGERRFLKKRQKKTKENKKMLIFCEKAKTAALLDE